MAHVERTDLTTPVPVEQAQLVDPGAFRFSNISAEVLQQSGGVLFELGRRELAAKNSLAVSAVVESRNLAGLEMQEFIKNNPDPDTWDEGLRKVLEKQGAIYTQQRFNSKTQKEQEIEQEAFKDSLRMKVGISAVNQNIENDIAISGKNVIDAISTDDGTTDAADNIDKQMKLYQKALERKYEKKVAAIHMEETLKEAQKLQIENVKKDIVERASVRPERMISFIDTELKSRVKGKKAFDEFELMTNEDLIEIRSYAESVAKNAITAERVEQKLRDDEIGAGFLDLLINKLDPIKPQLTFDMIVNADDMSSEAKGQWLTKLMTFDNYSEGELKEAFTDKGEVLAEIYDKIDAETLTDELDTMVGKGLSPTTAQRLKKERREPYEKDTDQLFKRIFGWSPELGFENDLSSFLYEKTLRDWKEEIKKQNATGEQIVEIGRSIARPYFIEHLQKTMMGQESDIARMVELALGEEVEKTQPEVKPKEDEGPRTIGDFEDEVARLKAIDMTKAKAFYDAWIDKFRETEIEE